METKATAKIKPRRGPTAPHRPNRVDWKLRGTGGVQILTAPQLADLDWLVHGFSTRAGGASELQSSARPKGERVLNLGFTDWDDRRNVLRNRKKFTECIGAAAMHMVTLRQIHSDIAHRIEAVEAAESGPALQGDALFTREPGRLLAVQTADCVPILLADVRTQAVAAIHSGWRGTLKRIAEKTLGRMKMEFGTRAEDVIAAIGPGIGGCCYEVGHEVAKEFASQFAQAPEWFSGPFAAIASGDNDPNWLPWLTMAPPGHAPEPPRVHLDLIAANRSILVGAGVQPGKIVVSQFCTSCRTDLLFSYRRERQTGRMMAAIGIRAKTKHGKRKSES